jgi:hypothetical protein
VKAIFALFPQTQCAFGLYLQFNRGISLISLSFFTGRDCAYLYKKGHRTNGVYSIDPDAKGAFRVRCDMTTSGGCWTGWREGGNIDEGYSSYVY